MCLGRLVQPMSVVNDGHGCGKAFPCLVWASARVCVQCTKYPVLAVAVILEPVPAPEPTHFLREIHRRPGKGDENGFPFSVPAIRTLDVLRTDTPVTFFVGENGSGKSTLLEAIAMAARLSAVGSADLKRDDSLGEQRYLSYALKLVWSRHTARGFFLRAEDFFGFTKRVSAMRSEFLAQLAEIEANYADRSEQARSLAMLPARRSLVELEQMYGVDLDANSHGQSFLKLFSSRFVPGGLYLLDEPEAPLSPQSQLAFMVMMQDMIAQHAQFIIATHSPMLLAFPGARIYSFDRAPVREVAYEELDHVVLTREFLNAPERYIRALSR